VIEDIATLARNFRWLELSRGGSKIVAIASRDRTTTRIVQAGIAAALAIEEDTGQRLLKPIKLPKDRPPPYELEPLLHMNGVIHTEQVCPKHPGKRIVSPGVTEMHANPFHRVWRQSNYCCLTCMRSAQDRRILKPDQSDPKPDREPTTKPLTHQRRETKSERKKRLRREANETKDIT
jgi:hypothetical protein